MTEQTELLHETLDTLNLKSVRWAVLTLSILLPSAAYAQAPAFDPFPNGSAAAYRFNLERNFYASLEIAEREQKQLLSRAKELAARAGRVTSGSQLYDVLAGWDSVSALAGRQYAYSTLVTSINTQDVATQRSVGQFAAEFGPLDSEVNRALGIIPAAQFAAYEASEGRLRKYGYAAELARRAQAHVVDPDSAETLNQLQRTAASWGASRFQETLATIDFGSVDVGGGRVLDLRRNGNEIRLHPDRSVRDKGYALNQAGIASRRDVFASIITRQAQARNAIARLRKWPDFPAESYAANELDRRWVTAMLSDLAARADINKAYERRRNEEIRRELGVDSVHWWDLWVPSPGRAAPRFTIQEATRHVIAAAAPLGDSYVKELGALLDPANGRLDLIPRANRVDRPGFSTGRVGYPSTFFQGRFEGFTDDLVILAHEAGHGVQNMLMDSAKVLPRYAGGPSYFTESFAMFSELLLLEHLAQSDELAADRRAFQRRLEEDEFELFRNAFESLLELQIYDSVSAGRPPDADGIERLTQAVGSRFSIWFGAGGRELAWGQPIQFFTRPLYRVHYVIAKLLALRYLDMLHQDPRGFSTRYAALLRNGYDAPPAVLLKRFLDIDFTDSKALVGSASRVFEGRR